MLGQMLDFATDPLMTGAAHGVIRLAQFAKADHAAGNHYGSAMMNAVDHLILGTGAEIKHGMGAGTAAQAFVNGVIGDLASDALGTKQMRKKAIRDFVTKKKLSILKTGAIAVPALEALGSAKDLTGLDKLSRYTARHSYLHGGVFWNGKPWNFDSDAPIKTHGIQLAAKEIRKIIGPKIDPKIPIKNIMI